MNFTMLTCTRSGTGERTEKEHQVHRLRPASHPAQVCVAQRRAPPPTADALLYAIARSRLWHSVAPPPGPGQKPMLPAACSPASLLLPGPARWFHAAPGAAPASRQGQRQRTRLDREQGRVQASGNGKRCRLPPRRSRRSTRASPSQLSQRSAPTLGSCPLPLCPLPLCPLPVEICRLVQLAVRARLAPMTRAHPAHHRTHPPSLPSHSCACATRGALTLTASRCPSWSTASCT